MKRFVPFIVLAVIGVGAQPVAALPVLPPNAGDITPSLDWEKALSPRVNTTGFDCTITSVTGSTAVTVGQKLSPMTNLMTDGRALYTLVNTPTANAGADCTSQATIPSTPLALTGTFAAPGMASVEGVGASGTIDLSCTTTPATNPVTVTVAANFGGAVAGKIKIVGKSGPSDVKFDCSMGLTFVGGAGLSGTISGTFILSDSANISTCTGFTGATCIPVGVSNATVTVVSGSGALADAQGSGSYSFNDLFKLSGLEQSFSQIPGLSVSSSGVRSAGARPQVAGNADELKLTLTKGAPKVVITNPVVSGRVSFGSKSAYDLLSTPGAKCTMTATYKKKNVTLGTTTLSAAGRGSLSVASSAKKRLTAVGIKKNTKVTFKISCGSGATAALYSSPGTYTG